MIKTEIAEDNENKALDYTAADTTAIPNSTSAPLFALIATIVVILALAVGYFIHAHSSNGHSLPPARSFGSEPALPLLSGSTAQNNANTGNSSLSANSINLQNNLPTQQGSPKTNSVQSTGNSLSTGQSINTAIPF